MAIDPKEELSAAIARKQAILFAGAGISMAVGLPSWQMLMEHLASDLGVDPGWVERPRDSYQTLAESYRITRGRIGPKLDGPELECLAGEGPLLGTPPSDRRFRFRFRFRRRCPRSALFHNLILFSLWSVLERVANLFGVRPRGLVRRRS